MRSSTTLRWVAAAAALATAEARAQTRAPGAYRAPPSGEDLVSTERAMVTPHLRVGALLVGDYAPSTATARAAVAHRVALHGAATFGLFDRLQLGVTFPVIVHQDAQGALPSPEAGDPGLDARVRLAGHARRGFARLAVAVGVTAPLTHDVVVTPRVLLEVTRAQDFVFALNVGARLQPGATARGVARAGASVRVARRVLLTAEALLVTPLDDPFGREGTALELLGGLHAVLRSGLVAGVAGGPGLLRGEGAADVRVVALAGYAPQPPTEEAGPGDRDADGVLDPDDACPDEPAGPRPDPARRGCPRRDRDGDGVRDDDDRCPDVPRGDDPDPEREGCPRLDRDFDGVADRDDLCPDVAAGRHPDASRRGCPDADPDRDGILGERDACPEEAGVPSNDPSTHGCPRVFVRGERVVIQQQPRFDVDRDVILPESFPLLGEVAAALEAHPELTRVEVAGHTDSVGNDAHNLDLSQRRAVSVARWLVARGIDEARLVARGYGEAVPLADNATAHGRALNRRVEFVIRERRAPPEGAP